MAMCSRPSSRRRSAESLGSGIVPLYNQRRKSLSVATRLIFAALHFGCNLHDMLAERCSMGFEAGQVVKRPREVKLDHGSSAQVTVP